jgi:hypothetical protein
MSEDCPSSRYRHGEKAFSADEAIFIAIIVSRKDCFPEKSGPAVVPPRNDDFLLEFVPLLCGYHLQPSTFFTTQL